MASRAARWTSRRATPEFWYSPAVPRRFRAAVIGATGYGGGEIIRRLLRHPEVELAHVVSIDRIGEPVARAHPNLEGQTDLQFVEMDAADAANGMDVVLLGLPHDVSARKVPEIRAQSEKVKIVDLSGAFRCRDAAEYERWYGARHPAPERLSEFVYGLPELNRAAIREFGRVANPGCFATTIELGVLPLARRGWLKGQIQTVAITGSSGSGASASAGTHHPVRAANIKSYKTLQHPQTAEIVDTLRHAGADDFQLAFVPVSAPLPRGLLATTFVQVNAELAEDELRGAYLEDYEAEPFVRVPQHRQPEVVAVAGSNHAEVGLVMGPAKDGLRTVTCISALDNLVKGGAGQAVQNMNLILGLDEMLSLEDPGSYP